VEDVVMPPIGVLLGKVDFASLFVVMPGQETKIEAAQAAGKHLTSFVEYKAAGIGTLNYGNFLNNIVQFVIVAIAIFMVVKAINHMKRPAPVAAPGTKSCPFCLSEIPLAATKCAHCTSGIPAA
jgi:large conductance mechanosensitive channel